jgi:hypothetical protein
MAGIGDLVANLTVNSAPFTKGLNSAKGGLSKFASAAGTALKVGVVGGLAAATAGIYKINEQLGILGQTAALANRTGFDPKFIAAWGYAVEQTGGNAEQAAEALSEINLRFGEATTGSGPLLEALDIMGLKLSDIETLSPEDKILKLSEAIATLPKAQQAFAADAMFGGVGVELVGAMEGIKDFKAEAEDMGLGFEASELAKVQAANEAINRVQKAFGNVWSTITVQVAPAIEGLFTGINDLSSSMGGFASMSDTVFSFVGDTWTWLQDTIATGITATMAIGEWAFTNWQDVAEYAFKSVALAGVTMGNNIAYFFTDQLPAYLDWFGKNWHQVFFTAFDFVTTAMINVGKNIRAVWSAVLDFIAGNGFSVDFTPILDGFVSTIGKLPDIPPRAMSELETNLQADVTTIGNRLGTSFDEIVTERLATLADMQKTAGLDKPNLNLAGTTERTAAKDGDTPSQGKASEMKSVGVMQQGSAEAMKTILSSQRSPELVESKKQTKLLEKLTKQKPQPASIKVQGAV